MKKVVAVCINLSVLLLCLSTLRAHSEEILFPTDAQIREIQTTISVSFDDIPIYLVGAMVAAEDRDYWTRFEQGKLSVITQNVARKLIRDEFGEGDKTSRAFVTRVAKNLTLMLSAEELLEIYINQMYFGRGAFGPEAAAAVYFDKSIEDLDIAETAYLATLLRAPTLYNTNENRDHAVTRRDFVLQEMTKMGAISEEERQSASSQSLDAVFDD